MDPLILLAILYDFIHGSYTCRVGSKPFLQLYIVLILISF